MEDADPTKNGRERVIRVMNAAIQSKTDPSISAVGRSGGIAARGRSAGQRRASSRLLLPLGAESTRSAKQRCQPSRRRRQLTVCDTLQSFGCITTQSRSPDDRIARREAVIGHRLVRAGIPAAFALVSRCQIANASQFHGLGMD